MKTIYAETLVRVFNGKMDMIVYARLTSLGSIVNYPFVNVINNLVKMAVYVLIYPMTSTAHVSTNGKGKPALPVSQQNIF